MSTTTRCAGWLVESGRREAADRGGAAQAGCHEGGAGNPRRTEAGTGTIVSIADVPNVSVGEVTVEGTMETLWEPSSTSIRQVGLIRG